MKKKIKVLITIILVIAIVLVFITFNKKQNVNKIYPSVVHLKCKNDKTSTVGSGIVYEEKNNFLYVVTNYHIIKGYSNIVAYDSDFNKETAKIINYDEENDIALLLIKRGLNVKKASFDFSGKIKEKEDVYVLTSFQNSDSSYIVKDAIVAKTKEKIKLDERNFDVIKLSYNVENGDSGSPVINKKGKVIGMIFLRDKNVLHYGYAMPINFVMEQVKNLINNISNNLNLGALMANSSNKELLKEYKIEAPSSKGVVVLSVKENYPLYNSEIKKGDLIVSFDNQIIENIEDLQKTLEKHKINDEVNIKYYRDGNLIETNIKLNK